VDGPQVAPPRRQGPDRDLRSRAGAANDAGTPPPTE
jgi:hypothetical protein